MTLKIIITDHITRRQAALTVSNREALINNIFLIDKYDLCLGESAICGADWIERSEARRLLSPRHFPSVFLARQKYFPKTLTEFELCLWWQPQRTKRPSHYYLFSAFKAPCAECCRLFEDRCKLVYFQRLGAMRVFRALPGRDHAHSAAGPPPKPRLPICRQILCIYFILARIRK